MRSSLGQAGEMLEERQDFAGAEAAYRKARDIDPSPATTAKADAAAAKARDARLPRGVSGAPVGSRRSRAAISRRSSASASSDVAAGATHARS